MNNGNISLTLEECKRILSGLALSDHLGDAIESMGPICAKVGIEVYDINMSTLSERDLLPEYLLEDD